MTGPLPVRGRRHLPVIQPGLGECCVLMLDGERCGEPRESDIHYEEPELFG